MPKVIQVEKEVWHTTCDKCQKATPVDHIKVCPKCSQTLCKICYELDSHEGVSRFASL
jgi:hypothetical protein